MLGREIFLGDKVHRPSEAFFVGQFSSGPESVVLGLDGVTMSRKVFQGFPAEQGFVGLFLLGRAIERDESLEVIKLAAKFTPVSASPSSNA